MISTPIDVKWRRDSFEEALKEAQISFNEGGIPVGAALDDGDDLISSGHNERVQSNDPIAHGEMACIRHAGRLKSYRNTILYTTLAPCAMCAGTIVQFKIPTVVVGESETFAGELRFLRDHGVTVIDLSDSRCIDLMKDFQARYPETWAEDIGEG